MSIVIIARWYPRPDSREDFLRAVGGLKDSLTPEMLASFSVLLPTMSRDGTIIFIEKWNDEAVMNKLRASPGFHDAIRQMSACCDRPLEIEHLNTVGDDGNFASLQPVAGNRYPKGRGNGPYYPDLGAMTPLFV